MSDETSRENGPYAWVFNEPDPAARMKESARRALATTSCPPGYGPLRGTRPKRDPCRGDVLAAGATTDETEPEKGEWETKLAAWQQERKIAASTGLVDPPPPAPPVASDEDLQPVPIDQPGDRGALLALPEGTNGDEVAAVRLVVEILDNREGGDRDTSHGNADEDLLAAVEEARPALAELAKRIRLGCVR